MVKYTVAENPAV